MVKELVEHLKQARLEKKITLAEIGEETKIQLYYLEALEKADFDKFPGEVYLKGALTNYAGAVGLDPGKILDLYHHLKGEEPPEEEKIVLPKKKSVPLPRAERAPSLIYGLIILALLLTAGGYLFVEQYWPKKSPGLPADPVEAPVDSEKNNDEPKKEEPKAPEKTVKLTVSESKSTSRETVFSVRNAAILNLKLSGHDRCWIEMRTDEEELPSRILEKDETITARAKNKIWIRLGHPPGVELKINGITVKETEEQNKPHNFLFVRK